MGDNTSSMTSSKGDNARLTMAETRLHINNGNDAIVTRARFAIATLANMPAH